MEVFQDKQQRILASDYLQYFTHLANHALACSAQDFLLERLSLIGLQERRELNQPRRRMLDQCLYTGAAVLFTKKLPEGLKHRVIRLLGAEALDTLTASYT